MSVLQLHCNGDGVWERTDNCKLNSQRTLQYICSSLTLQYRRCWTLPHRLVPLRLKEIMSVASEDLVMRLFTVGQAEADVEGDRRHLLEVLYM
jgi:hypothetical protein